MKSELNHNEPNFDIVNCSNFLTELICLPQISIFALLIYRSIYQLPTSNYKYDHSVVVVAVEGFLKQFINEGCVH